MKKQDWILGIGGSVMDGVALSIIHGTKEQVKEHLLNCVLGEKALADNEGDWDFGTESIEEIQERDDGSLYAYGCYYDFHTDYEATPMEKIMRIKK